MSLKKGGGSEMLSLRQEALGRARKAARMIDTPMSAFLRIASLSRERDDAASFVEAFDELPVDEQEQIVVWLIKALAYGGRLEEAREKAGEIKRILDRAQARVAIASCSQDLPGHESDLAQAREAIAALRGLQFGQMFELLSDLFSASQAEQEFRKLVELIQAGKDNDDPHALMKDPKQEVQVWSKIAELVI